MTLWISASLCGRTIITTRKEHTPIGKYYRWGVRQFSYNKLELFVRAITKNRCIAQHDTPASFLIFYSMERRAFQVVLHLPGQHQAGIFHRRVV